jgi:hypothetical protein
MRISILTRLATVAAALSVSCAYDFSVEDGKYICDGDDDCVDGFVCGGETIFKGRGEKYCVKPEALTAGIWLSTESPMKGDALASKTCKFEDLVVGAALTISPTRPAPPVLSADYPSTTETRADCVGAVLSKGELRVLCRRGGLELPAGSYAAERVIVFRDPTASGLVPTDPLQWWATVFAAGPITMDDPLLDFTTVPWDSDLDADPMGRCKRAAVRACLDPVVCESACDASSNPCPGGLTCDLGICK